MTGWKPASPSPGCRPARSRLAPPLRAAAGPQFLALAARHRRGPAALGPHHPDRRARSAAGRTSPTAATSRRSSPRRPTTVVLSRARRDSDGRLLGRSPLLAGHGDETYLRRNAMPAHAFSETDRLMARPQEFAADPQAVSAQGCWRDWRRAEITPHDGLVRADHPLVLAILGRTQSASSLRRLLRNPLGFVWVYAFGWREPQSSAEPLVLDALGDRRSRPHGSRPRLARPRSRRRARRRRRGDRSKRRWSAPRKPSPLIGKASVRFRRRVIWRRTLDDARVMAGRALTYGDDVLPGARAYGEVPFGGSEPKSDAQTPWDASAPVDDSRHRLQHRRLHRPARHLGRRQARARARLQDRPAAARRHPAGRRHASFSAASTPSRSRRCSATTSRSAPRCSTRASRSISSSTIPRRCSRRSPATSARRGPASPAARRCLARTPAATMTTSPSPCRRTPAPPIANASSPAATERLGDAAQVWEAE